ncbi:MAG: hypothetical protein F6K63_08395 [Moorea sp. SIO1G6]|uniref:hypothetical protein n=1 Tax=Moorena sp. SIO1G6 TaxID=2607840 RepID=UPI0013BF1744|nr:hypothetical protein [Moorena sp. SIO1G6]NET64405.1 hypothetical protein [Moorena sp. SIO1G6]
MSDNLVLLKPPKSPKRGIARLGDFESFIPPKIGGLGGRNHTQNQQRLIFRLLVRVMLLPVTHHRVKQQK